METHSAAISEFDANEEADGSPKSAHFGVKEEEKMKIMKKSGKLSYAENEATEEMVTQSEKKRYKDLLVEMDRKQAKFENEVFERIMTEEAKMTSLNNSMEQQTPSENRSMQGSMSVKELMRVFNKKEKRERYLKKNVNLEMVDSLFESVQEKCSELETELNPRF